MSTVPKLQHRTLPVSVVAAVTLATLVSTPTLASSHEAHSPAHAALSATHGAPAHALPGRAVAFHDGMRKLWEDHVTWTRLAIVSFADGSAGFDATAARLLQNQADLGDAIKPFFGAAAGDRLTALLRDHITIAVELLQAAKANDAVAVTDAADRWYANADDIADLLAAANPRFWPRDTLRADMRHHLDQTLAEAQHELTGQYAASVEDYEAVHAHILAMADLLSDGIMRRFPQRFR